MSIRSTGFGDDERSKTGAGTDGLDEPYGLSLLGLDTILPMPEVVKATTLSVDSLDRNHRDKIARLSERRRGMTCSRSSTAVTTQSRRLVQRKPPPKRRSRWGLSQKS